jgi:hypothetical protein
MLIQNPVPDMPAIPPPNTLSHVPRSSMASGAHLPRRVSSINQSNNKLSSTNVAWAYFAEFCCRLTRSCPISGFSISHPYGGSGNSVSRSWDHFLVDERRFTSAKNGIWSSVVVGFGLRAGSLAVLECARDCRTTCWILS